MHGGSCRTGIRELDVHPGRRAKSLQDLAKGSRLPSFFSLFLALWALRGKMGWGRNTSCMFTTPWPGGRQSPAPGADGPLAWVQRAGSCSLRLGNESCVAQTRRRRQRTWGCAFIVTETETEQL